MEFAFGSKPNGSANNRRNSGYRIQFKS